MKNLFCRQLLTENYNMLPIEEMKSTWNKNCFNKETLSGYPVYLFKDLEKLENKFCVRPDEMFFIGNRNPYTNKQLIWRSGYRMTVPVTEEYNDRLCPLEEFDSSDKYSFIASSLPIMNIQSLPEKIPVRRSLSSTFSDSTGKQVFVVSTINPSQIYSLYYYVIKIEKPLGKNQTNMKRENIVSMRRLYKRQKAKTLFDKIKNANVKKELKDYFMYFTKTFSPKVLSLLKELKLYLHQPIKAYRGILIHSIGDLQKAKLDKLSVGDTMIIDSRGLPISWSTDSCLSQYFATHGAAKAIPRDSLIQFGILYSCVLQPDQIAIDTRLIDRKFFNNKLYFYDQQEIITLPFTSDGKKNEFKCVIERLFLVKTKDNIHTLVHSFTKILPLLPKTD